MESESEAASPSGRGPSSLRASGLRRGGSGLIDVALVGVGGAAGALTRYVLSETFNVAGEYVTLGINVVGAFLLGLLVAVLAGRRPRVQLLVGTGLLGGFTTYSMLALHASELVLQGQYVLALVYGIGTVVLGFAAMLAGVGSGSVARRLLVRHA